VTDGATDTTIRVERPDDRASVAEVVGAAFGGLVEVRLVEAVRASPEFIPELSLVAEVDRQVVGHVMVSFTALVDGETEHRIHHLSPLAVAPAFRGQGIGSALVRRVTELADGLGAPFVILEGAPGYYGRLGFEHAVRYGVEINLPSWAPPEAAQLLRLSRYDPSVRGRVVYPPAFDEVTEH
jgi:putative acetyltransferase